MNQITNKKFAAHALLFDSQKWILTMIENCGPFVEKIYVAYSELPWTYNPSARDTIKNTADPSILLNSQYANKIELIHGVWERDEDQRNACLDRAKADGMDFLIIQDADEFYKQSDYSRMLEQIANNPEYDFYKTPWCVFWKSFDYILEGENGSTVIGFPEVAINCKHNVRFTRARVPNSQNYFLLDVLCYHGSYVSTDDEMYRKIHTWGHAHQFDRDMWYQNKWLRWTESTEGLHPVSPSVFRRAVRFKGDLPEVLISKSGADGAFNSVETPSSTLSNGLDAATIGSGFCEEKSPHSTDSRKETCPATPVTKGMVSIVIPTITVSYLAECIQSIEKNTSCQNYEIIIVNDGSSEPEFMDYLASTKHRVLNLPNNVGFAGANNEGFKAAKGDYIMTLNADTLVHESWLTIMINTLESCKDIATVGPTVLYAGTNVIETGGCFWSKDNVRKVTLFLMGKQIQDYPQINTAYRVDTIGGACMLFKRRMLFEVGLFDGNFVNGWEDIDICLSLRDKGYKMYHAPAVIEHYGSFARNKSSKELASKRLEENMQYFYKKLKLRAVKLYDAAEQLAQKKLYNEAIKYYLMAIETDALMVGAYYNLAVVYHNINQKDASITYFKKVVELEPQNANVHNNLGVLFLSKGFFEEAEYHFKKAIALDNKDAIQNLEIMNLKKLYAPTEG